VAGLIIFALFLVVSPATDKTKPKSESDRFKRLIRRLEIEDYLVRMATLNYLFECNDKAALEPVRRIFSTTKDTDQKFWCACIMLRLGDKSVKKFLLDAFLSENERERYHAAAAFGRARVADKKVLERIEELWRNDTVPHVKTVAAYALCALGNKKAEKFLLEKLKEKNWLSRDMAAVLCGWLKLKPAFEFMKKAWPTIRETDKKLAVAFAWGMAKFGHKEAMKYLVEEGSDGLTGQIAICELGSVMIPYLIAVLKDEKKAASVRRNAALLLGLIADEAALEPLIRALSDRVTSVATSAARALAYTMHKKATRPLSDLAADQKANLVLRRAAVRALAILKDPSSIPALRSVLLGETIRKKSSTARRLRDAAAAALAKIDHPSAAKALADLLAQKTAHPRLIRSTLYYIRKQKRKSKPIITAVLALLHSKDERLKKDGAATLKELTGFDCGTDPQKWRKVLKKHNLID